MRWSWSVPEPLDGGATAEVARGALTTSGLGNEDTLLVNPAGADDELASFRDGFVANYDRLRRLVQEHERPSVLMVALGARGIQASGLLTPRAGRIQSAVIGRHTAADLHLAGDPGISLRHLCLILHPRGLGQALRFRVADLRTLQAFRDEAGRRRRAIESDGTVFLRCGRYRLMFFPLTAEANGGWPEGAEDGWRAIPERVYYDESEATERRISNGAGEQTLVEGMASPTLVTEPLVRSGEEILGELAIDSKAGRRNYRVGRAAARAGVILGRASRCEADGVLTDRHISRVHLLVIEVGRRLYAIDTASLNGVWSEEPERRVWELSDRSTLSICGRARVVWRAQ